jgi:hypothetical protein
MTFIPLYQHRPRFAPRSIVQCALLVTLGCTQWSAVPNGTVPRPDVEELRLHLRNGSNVTLKGAFFSPDSIEGLAPDGTRYGSRIAVALADVYRIDEPHLDFVRTTGLLIAIAAVGFATVVTVIVTALAHGP